MKLTIPLLEHLECYHDIFSDDRSHHFIIDEGKQNLHGSRRKLMKLIEINDQKKIVRTIMYNKRPVGFIVIHLDQADTPFISYAIRSNDQRKGLASFAIKELLSIYSQKFQAIQAATHLDNRPSQELLRKLNFKDLGEKVLEMGERRVFIYSFKNNLKA